MLQWRSGRFRLPRKRFPAGLACGRRTPGGEVKRLSIRSGQSSFLRVLRRQDGVGISFVRTMWAGLALALLAAAPAARAQDPPPVDGGGNNVLPSHPVPPKRPPAQDITIEGMGSFGHYRIFAGGEDGKMYTGGIEYGRNSWGPFLHARNYYVAEILPIMRLNEAANTDIWGDRLGPGRRILYGAGFSPIGIRLVWGNHALRPFFSAKAGLVVWDHKFISNEGSYIQFSLRESAGLFVKMNDRYDLRLGLIGDFHQSNGFMVDVNPGLDVANYEAGLVYHLGGGRAGQVR